jgi:cell division septation protein DedD
LEPPVLLKAAAGMRANSAADLLPTIEAPTLVLAAGKDVFTPVRCSVAMHRLIPDSELIVYPEGHHTLPIEEPGPLADEIDDFLTRHEVVGPEPASAAASSERAATAATAATAPKGAAQKRPRKKVPAKKQSATTTAKKAAGTAPPVGPKKATAKAAKKRPGKATGGSTGRADGTTPPGDG